MKVYAVMRFNGHHIQCYMICATRELAEKHLEEFLNRKDGSKRSEKRAWIEEHDLITE